MRAQLSRWWVALVVLVLAGCGESVRERECDRFSDWHNELGQQIERAVPTSRLTRAQTNEERAAWYRERATAMRAVAGQPIPFTDARVAGYAQRILATFGPPSHGLDAEAAPWARGSGDGTRAAQVADVEAQASRQPILDDWSAHCRD